MKPSNTPEIKIRQALEHRILNGLACEWQNAVWILDRSLRTALHQPFFRLYDYKNRLGSWHHEKNEIGSWDAVIEVLVHKIT